MSLAVEANIDQISLETESVLTLGAMVRVTRTLYQKRGVSGGVEWDCAIADLETYEGFVASVPPVDDTSNMIEAYHVDRIDAPTHIVPTYDVAEPAPQHRRNIPGRFIRSTIAAI